MRTLLTTVCVLVGILSVSACGGGGGGGGSSNPLGLNGTYGGILEDIDFDLMGITVSVEGSTMTHLAIDGVGTGQTAAITRLEDDVFEYLTNTGVIGGVLTDPTKTYGVFVNELWDFGVIERDASAPFGAADPNDINGSWSGSVIGFFANDYYRYPAQGVCVSGQCTFTVTGPVRDRNGVILVDATGEQSQLEMVHRTSLVFDHTFQADSGVEGFGAAILSPDRNFVGIYACPPPGYIEDCEFGAFTRE
jgi:hypothetical protein